MSRYHLSVSRLVSFLAVALLTISSAPLFAETFVVNRFDDDNGPCTPDDCALREAVLAANALPGPDIVEIPGGTYRLSLVGPVEENFGMTGDIDIRDDLELLGDPNTTVTIIGDGVDRVLQAVLADSVLISNVTVSGGNAQAGGGGIRSSADEFLLRDCIIRGNTAAFGDGGGVLFGGESVLIKNSTFTNNSAPNGRGGGIHMRSSSLFDFIDLRNVTISGNSANVGGGLSAFGSANYRISHSTIADNTAPLVNGVLGDLLRNLTFENSLIVNNDCGYAFAIPNSNGHNVEGPTDTCFVPGSGDLVGVADLALEPLADNGGRTPTRALPEGSPAIDIALDADCPATDQRGAARPLDGDGDGSARCDAGAYEADTVEVLEVPTLGGAGRLLLAGLLVALGVAYSRREIGRG